MELQFGRWDLGINFYRWAQFGFYWFKAGYGIGIHLGFVTVYVARPKD